MKTKGKNDRIFTRFLLKQKGFTGISVKTIGFLVKEHEISYQ